jgi:hypothetical protein
MSNICQIMVIIIRNKNRKLWLQTTQSNNHLVIEYKTQK